MTRQEEKQQLRAIIRRLEAALTPEPGDEQQKTQ